MTFVKTRQQLGEVLAGGGPYTRPDAFADAAQQLRAHVYGPDVETTATRCWSGLRLFAAYGRCATEFECCTRGTLVDREWQRAPDIRQLTRGEPSEPAPFVQHVGPADAARRSLSPWTVLMLSEPETYNLTVLAGNTAVIASHVQLLDHGPLLEQARRACAAGLPVTVVAPHGPGADALLTVCRDDPALAAVGHIRLAGPDPTFDEPPLVDADVLGLPDDLDQLVAAAHTRLTGPHQMQAAHQVLDQTDEARP